MDDRLSELREKIDEIDSELISSLASRMEVVREIGELKRQKGLPIRDNERWQKVVTQAKKEAEEVGVSTALIEDVFEAIHSAALEIETEDA